jgi:DNA-directed RNA polymerase subunit RPC12/RpoP
MHDIVSFQCPGCQRRLRASIQYVGQSCPCPSCGQMVLVPPRIPTEESSLLVMDDGFRAERSR